jgi:hypothetical protein
VLALQDLPDADLLKALQGFLEFLVSTFGPDGTLLLFLALYTMFVFWRWYNHRREDRAQEDQRRVYEDRIESLERRDREWRRLFFTHAVGLTEEDVRYILTPPEDTHSEPQQPAVSTAQVERRRR